MSERGNRMAKQYVLTSWYQLVRAGTRWYERYNVWVNSISWYQLVRAGTSWYSSWYAPIGFLKSVALI